MATSDRNQILSNLRRWHINRTTPLEIWDVVIDGRILWEWQQDECFPEILSSVLAQLVDGTALGHEMRKIQHIPLSYDRLYMTGGGSQLKDLRRQFPEADFSRSPVFGGCEAALSFWDDPLVIDVGQTQIKVAYEDERIAVPRDFQRLPINAPSDYSCLLDFIAGALPKYNPQNAVLALPCSIGSDLSLGDSSYSSMKGNPFLLEDLSKSYPEATWHILNDAELASLCAIKADMHATLVLTIGFGVGACLVNSHD